MDLLHFINQAAGSKPLLSQGLKSPRTLSLRGCYLWDDFLKRSLHSPLQDSPQQESDGWDTQTPCRDKSKAACFHLSLYSHKPMQMQRQSHCHGLKLVRKYQLVLSQLLTGCTISKEMTPWSFTFFFFLNSVNVLTWHANKRREAQ